MRKILIMFLMALTVSVTAFADGFNPFDKMYKAQAHKEMQRGVAQFNYMIVDEAGVAVPNVELRYFNRDNRLLTTQSDAQGKIHMEFRQPNFVQLSCIVIDDIEYRILGDDISEDVDNKDLNKGEVEYFVIQKNTANQSAYVFEAD